MTDQKRMRSDVAVMRVILTSSVYSQLEISAPFRSTQKNQARVSSTDVMLFPGVF